MRLPLHVALAFVTVVVIAAAWGSAVSVSAAAPVPLAVSALYLGLTSRGHLASAVAAAIVAGYLGDVLAGSPRGLFALTCAFTAMVGYVVQGRFVLRGHLIGAAVAALAALGFLLVSSGLAVAVGVSVTLPSAPLLGACAILTAALGPLQLLLHRRIDFRLARTQRGRDATLEGVSAA